MDTNQRIFMIECEQQIQQETPRRNADRWYPTEESFAEPTLRDALADLLFDLALWVAPTGERKEHARTLGHG